MAGMKSSNFSKRYVIKNPEILNAYFEKGISVILLTMHYNNWEWSIYLQLQLKHRILGVYKPLHNEVFDSFINKVRSKFGSEMIQNANILRRLLQARQNNEPVITWLAGDQTPPYFHKSWFKFLNQEALFYNGPAVLSQRFNQPVFLQKTIKTSRGKYETSFELMFENPGEVNENEILKKYIHKIEEIIREKPEFYLWSHKRWKHKRPEEIPLNE
jgi:KDO2-lipid IV(A) lauroyltransferase